MLSLMAIELIVSGGSLARAESTELGSVIHSTSRGNERTALYRTPYRLTPETIWQRLFEVIRISNNPVTPDDVVGIFQLQAKFTHVISSTVPFYAYAVDENGRILFTLSRYDLTSPKDWYLNFTWGPKLGAPTGSNATPPATVCVTSDRTNRDLLSAGWHLTAHRSGPDWDVVDVYVKDVSATYNFQVVEIENSKEHCLKTLTLFSETAQKGEKK
jgi:hypothetical protein